MKGSDDSWKTARLEGRDLSLSFGRTTALNGISMTLEQGEAVAVMGPSGSGKSSLLHCLSGVLRPSAGEVILSDQRIDNLSDQQLSAVRRKLFGFVFQFGDLLPELSLAENVAMPLQLLGTKRREAERAARVILDRLGIGPLATRRPSEVSGGEMQRAAVGRAIIHGPRVVFADEPTGALDSATAATTLDLVFDLQIRKGASLLVVTHDPEVAARADRTVRIRDGAIADSGTPTVRATAG
jgi:putative ABC transport system ATP-binding protein